MRKIEGSSGAPRRRRQWGADKRTEPLPAYTQPPSDRSLTLSRVAMVVTVLGWLAYVTTTILRQFINNGTQSMRFTSEAVSYLLVVTLLTSSALAYLVARHGFLVRTRAHRRVPRSVIDDHFSRSMPTLTVLVPSYREDARVVRQTLLSAALQEYPFQRVVLLVDDPPAPTDPDNQRLLAEALALPAQIHDLLALPLARAEDALAVIERRAGNGSAPTAEDMANAAEAYWQAAEWVLALGRDESARAIDHTDTFLGDHVLGRLGQDLESVADAICAATDDDVVLSVERLLQLHRRLVWTFRTEVSAFQRKAYANLSHEPNKAMNLNSYIGLAGGAYREERTELGVRLVPAAGGRRDMVVPDPDFLLTLDADSVLLPEYCLRLVHLMGQPENQDVAVAQTPYSAYPGSSTRLERLAGATTDIQHISHQGMTAYDATFWVGANAVLRKAALNDIETTDRSEGIEVHRYIQDRTVIEDTESSIDLVVHGWRLFNYPERLSYSATPPDFGSLSVQRQRWANGGLLILPKLWNQVRNRRRRGERTRPGELLLRINYMASICWASFGLLLLLAYPYSERLLSPLVVLSAAPYFLAMSSDLKRCGYKRLDVLRIYGFNLVFLPVNLAGVITSLGQAISGRKIAFKRTPKVRDRTTAGFWFVVLPYALVAFSVWTLVRDLSGGRWGHAVFAGTNAALAFYAIVAFIGLRNSVVDVFANVVQRLYRRDAPNRDDADETGPAKDPGWAAVLHYGSSDLEASAAAHLQEVAWLRDRRTRDRPAPTTLPVEVLATIEARMDDLAQGENLMIYRDADGFRLNRSGRPIPHVEVRSTVATGDPDDRAGHEGGPRHDRGARGRR
ncbi:hypothetical protein BH10ACT1_BH10ACT1_28810 [soil metagenome]